MCGIIGMVTTLKTKEWQSRRTWLEKALFVDTLRGKDSTGIACIPHDVTDDVIIHKKAMNGSDYLDLTRTQKLFYNVDNYRSIIGHNRSATLGEVNNTNAHPFQCGNITLVHNGTMDFWTGLDNSFDVDSEAICHAMSTRVAKDVLEDLDGAYALVWYDALDHSIHFARNKERPFHFAFSESGDTMLFASEAWMIEHLCPSTIKLGDIFSLVEGKHVTITGDQEDLTKYQVEEFKPFDPPFVQWPSYGSTKGKKDRPKQAYSPTSMTTTPTSTSITEKEKEMQKLLEQLGYPLHSRIQFWPTNFIRYTKGTKGTLRGITDTVVKANVGVQDRVVAFGVDELLGDMGYLMSGRAYGATRQDGQYHILVDQVDWADLYSKENDTGTVLLDDTYEIKILNSRGDEITKKEFDLLAGRGCALCTGEVEAEDSEFIEWTQEGHPLCLECTNELEKKAEEG